VAGPFFFAWTDAGDLDFGPEHVRNDEEILSFTISHDEGNFPSFAKLQMTIRIRSTSGASRANSRLTQAGAPHSGSDHRDAAVG
jgi:hypothetical protein